MLAHDVEGLRLAACGRGVRWWLLLIAGASAVATAGCGSRGNVPRDQVFVVGLDGAPPRQLADDERSHDALAWSPDGRAIAWIADGAAVEIATPDGSARRRLALPRSPTAGPPMAGGAPSALAWSPTGGRLGVAGNGEVLLANERGLLVRLVRSPNVSREIAWSPDGRWLAVVETRQRQVGPRFLTVFSSTLAIADARGTILRRLRAPGEIVGALAWSPDSRALAFSTQQDRPAAPIPPRPPTATPPPPGAPAQPTQPQLDLSVVWPQRSLVRRVTKTPASERDPKWTVRGQRILVTRSSLSDVSLWAFAPDGSRARRLTPDLRCVSESWSPDRRKILVGACTGRPPVLRYRLYTLAASGGRLQALGFQTDTLTAAVDAEHVALSPDGSLLAFVEFGPQRYAKGRLVVVRPDGRGRHVVATLSSTDIGQLTWSRQGHKLAFVASPARPSD